MPNEDRVKTHIAIIAGSARQGACYRQTLWKSDGSVASINVEHVDQVATSGLTVDEIHLYGTWYFNSKFGQLYSCTLTCLKLGGKVVVVPV